MLNTIQQAELEAMSDMCARNIASNDLEWLLRFLDTSLRNSKNLHPREVSLQDHQLEELLSRTAEYQVRLGASSTHFILGDVVCSGSEKTPPISRLNAV